MTLGHVRDNFPRLTWTLPSLDGAVRVEFIVDTGFEGDLALPQALIARLKAVPATDRRVVRLADGSLGRVFSYEVAMEWNGEERPTDVLALEGAPLLGVELLAGFLLQVEMTDGGEVSVEAL